MFPNGWWELAIWAVAAWIAVFALVKMMKARREFLVGEMRKQIEAERERLVAKRKRQKQLEAQKRRQEAKLARKKQDSLAA